MSTTYYINGTNFSTANTVYTDAELTTPASDGYYRLGGITRQQLNGQLREEEACNDCSVVACNTEVSQPYVSGTVRRSSQVFFDGGTDTGAMVIVVKLLVPSGDTQQIPIGLRVNYNGVNYNNVVRKLGDTSVLGTAAVNDAGYANVTATVPSEYIIVGSNRACLINQLDSSFTHYLWNGTSFDGTKEVVSRLNIYNENRAQNDTGGNPDGPEYVVLVVPKLYVNERNVLVDIIQDCDAGFDVYAHCPTVLTETVTLYGGGASTGTDTAAEACASTSPTTLKFYAVGSGSGINADTSLVTLNPTQPQLRDVLFLFEKGIGQLTSSFDSWYRVDTGIPSTNYAIKLEDGIVADTSDCEG